MPLWVTVLATVTWLLMLFFWRANRIWLPYYITGTVGLAFLLIFFGAQATPIQEWLQRATVLTVSNLSSVVHIPTRVFSGDLNAIMIMVVSQDIGWTMLDISIESSGLLETCVVVSMVMFYPGWSLRKKAGLAMFGVAATFVANVLRLMMITVTLHYLGKDSLLISHTIAGRLMFFALMIAIFWFVITRPTLDSVRRKLETEAKA